MEFLNEKCRKTAQKTQNKIKYLYTETKICVIIILTKIITARGDNVIKKEMIAMLLAGGQGSRSDKESSQAGGIFWGEVPYH